MTLEAMLDDKAKIPEGFGDHYKEVDGKFILQVGGMKTQDDFDNYAEALKKRYADAAADVSRKTGAGVTRDELMTTVEEALKKAGVSTGKPNGKGDQDQGGDVSARLHDLERNLASLTEKNELLEKERDDALGTSRSTTITNALTQAATKAGATPDGVGNLVQLVEDKFEVSQAGDVVTKLEAGKGVTPNQAPTDYFASLARIPEFRMFWPKSAGAGADAGSGGGGSGDLSAANPWSKAGWNVTNQSKQYTADKPEAERLMKAAGVGLGATSPVR
jgi:hypothetical protein